MTNPLRPTLCHSGAAWRCGGSDRRASEPVGVGCLSAAALWSGYAGEANSMTSKRKAESKRVLLLARGMVAYSVEGKKGVVFDRASREADTRWS